MSLYLSLGIFVTAKLHSNVVLAGSVGVENMKPRLVVKLASILFPHVARGAG